MSIIRNRAGLATNALRRAALDIIEAGIARILPAAVMRSAISYDRAGRVLRVRGGYYPLAGGRLFVIGGGKAAGLMAAALEDIVGAENITAGLVADKGGEAATRRIEVVTAGHPIPDARGAAAVGRMLALKEDYGIGEGDLVLCLISGGGSALLPGPAEGLSLQDKQGVTGLLLGCGAAIGEINAVRKHLSSVKGGRLGRYFAPATVVSLILSDVIGNDLGTIASGPTYPDATTYEDAYNVLAKYGLLAEVPPGVAALLEKGRRGQVEETPKELANCRNYIIGDNTLALEAMAAQAVALGFRPRILTAALQGDTGEAARRQAAGITGEGGEYDVFLLGGETTPKLPPEPGQGGRNQHYAAASLPAMEGYGGEWVVASVGTDGSDFLPEVAGAVVDSHSLAVLEGRGIDITSYLERYDSYNLLDKLGNALIVTGNTGTNVGDVIVYILGPR